MSWDAYVDTLVGYCLGHADKGAIIGQDGSGWTGQTADNCMKVSQAEAATISGAMNQNGCDFGGFQAAGIFVEGIKYQFLRSVDNEVAIGKKKDHGTVILQITKSAILITHCAEGKTVGICTVGSAKLSEYMVDQGF